MGKCFSTQLPEVKVIILGTSGSGKSTFTQQLKIINSIETSMEHRKSYNDLLLKNILYGIREVSVQILEMELPVKEKNRRTVRFFNENDAFLLDVRDENLWEKVRKLWGDESFVDAWNMCKTKHTQISQMDFLMGNMDRYLDPENIPNDEDILHARQRTTGAFMTRFSDGSRTFCMVDVGGQKPERKKWIDLLRQGVKCIIFFSALDEYDVESAEAENATKLEVSKQVFADLVNDEEFLDVLVIVFFNKYDLFQEKIHSTKGYESWKEQFPEFDDSEINFEKTEEGDELSENCTKFLEAKYREKVEFEEKVLFFYTTTAINRDQTELVFDSLKMKITLDKLSSSGFNI